MALTGLPLHDGGVEIGLNPLCQSSRLHAYTPPILPRAMDGEVETDLNPLCLALARESARARGGHEREASEKRFPPL